MLHGSRVLVVVPAFREAPRIGRVLATMPAWVDDVLVVDDASDDATTEAARAAGDARTTVLRHGTNRGVGAAIATGYAEALGRTSSPADVVAVMAGDGQMHPDDLEAVVRPVAAGEADYVKGNRFSAPEVWSVMPKGRHAAGRVLSVLTTLATGQRVTDSQCGYTAISRGALARLDLTRFWPGFGYPNDLLGVLAVGGFRVTDVPVRPVYGDEESKLRPKHVPVVVGLVARAYVRRLRGRTRSLRRLT